MIDDEQPLPRPRRVQPLVLDTFGVVELEAYIGELHDEIARAKAEIDRKQAHRSVADAFFKPPA